MKIVYIRESQAKGVYSVGVSCDGNISKYSILARDIDTTYLTPGCPVDDELLGQIISSDECYRATRVALRLLSVGIESLRGLALKLSARRIGRDTIKRVTDYIISCGYINEKRDIRELLLSLANTCLFGERKLVARLVGRHYRLGMVESVLGKLVRDGEIDFAENARRLIEKKLPEDSSPEEIKKLLYKYGYKITEE